MKAVAILGAGDLGATLARLLAERECARHVVLVDPDEGKARGKALDITQSGPVEHYDTRVEGRASLEQAVPCDAVLVADPPELADDPPSEARAGDLARALIAVAGQSIVVVAGPGAPHLVEALVRRGFPADRVVGSLPLAVASAVRRRLGEQLTMGADGVTVGLLGDPPARVFVPQGSAVAGGVPVEKLAANAVRRAVEAAHGHVPGPVTLAHAARRVLKALSGGRGTVLPVHVWLDGAYGHRGVVLAVPALLGKGRVLRVVEVPLDPVDRVALDTAAERRERAR